MITRFLVDDITGSLFPFQHEDFLSLFPNILRLSVVEFTTQSYSPCVTTHWLHFDESGNNAHLYKLLWMADVTKMCFKPQARIGRVRVSPLVIFTHDRNVVKQRVVQILAAKLHVHPEAAVLIFEYL